jgi:hypothetical protein
LHLGDSGAGTATLSACRLVAFKAEGGTAAFNNRGTTFAVGDRLEDAEEFIDGECYFFGAPNVKIKAYFRF